ncbi:hypothetical protein D3C78_189970 [compost metagenome]
MNWQGMNADNGRTISETDHIIQSVRDILTTPIGTRITKVEIGAPELSGGCAVTLTWRRTDNGLLESGTITIPTGAAN